MGILKEGDELTVDHDIIGISGDIHLSKDQKVRIRRVEKRDGFWGKYTQDWHPTIIIAIGIEGMEESVFFPTVFKETKHLYNK